MRVSWQVAYLYGMQDKSVVDLQKFYKGEKCYRQACMSLAWFFGYDVIFELFFLVISLFIALFALKVYRNTGQKPAQFFGFGFLLVALAYLTKSLFNFLVYSRLNTQVCQMAQGLSVSALDALGKQLYMLLMISGIVLILFVSLKSDKRRTLLILLAASIVAIFLSSNQIYTFYLLSSIYLAFIALHFIEHYLKNRQTKTLLVALAFVFLWFGTFHFLISVNHEIFYVIGQVLNFFAYIMILMNWRLLSK